LLINDFFKLNKSKCILLTKNKLQNHETFN
jgi:hypothetical protein